MLFGVPEHKDAIGSGATDPDGILNVATRVVVAEVGDALVVQTDLCLDEFTDHGHCGVLDAQGRVDNDATLERYRDMAVAQAEAGSAAARAQRHDGRPGRRRARRARRGRPHRHRRSSPTPRSTRRRSTGRSARPSSPRSRATAAPTSSTRRTAARALREVALDLDEGADIVMVKPAMSATSTCSPTSPRHQRRAGLGVPGLRRVRDDRGGRRERLDRPAPRDRGVGHRHPPRRRGCRAHLLGDRSSRSGCDDATSSARRRRATDATPSSSAPSAAIPGGVNSPVRAFRLGRRHAAVHRLGAAARTSPTSRAANTSTSSRSWGPAILGHAHPAVVDGGSGGRGPRSRRSARRRRRETELAELVERVGATAHGRSRSCGSSRPAPRRR